ncbi:conserved hypothetical protein [Leishmania braziliensis MHOM/BR/75/M2904]|uniref:ADP-ribosylation factor-like protein n=2 Tax=Leishmania braziliensis TaxID=5660 RepID=A4H7G7_LEIBR|nr:conserved hypothetical protein [Leishmania braziliensis MHOM/BR/75/M2904]KAI5685272.1 hypothetical protein MNV84_01980 [Leishmania braziliensis]CAJ2469134.1 unnamed protein product [Leishmania braziliensis]CAJ2469450.1 unnamed protein product [Leishmania braziliensis]CAM37475.1 conserved hypothetical protein [Leishmania braziliensis MHOM/BR/75/M2904]SYZ63982.1 hypothetical_protein [Leishmania braziliensis MHOM/BR/75/M2904]
MLSSVTYVLGTESCGKTDLVRQLEYLSQGVVRTVPTSCTPTMGQEVTVLTIRSPAGEGKVTVEVRELGGSLVNVWESFIESRKAKEIGGGSTAFLLLYVVDGVAPHQLPLASTMFRYLTQGRHAPCAGWSTLIAVQKCASVNAVTAEEVRGFFLDEVSTQSNVDVVEVDSWNGIGAGDVLRGIEAVFGAPR